VVVGAPRASNRERMVPLTPRRVGPARRRAYRQHATKPTRFDYRFDCVTDCPFSPGDERDLTACATPG